MARPQKLADVLAEVLVRRGVAREQATQRLDAAWQGAAGPLLAAHTRAGEVRRGALEVIVAHSALMQEITFQKAAILAELAQRLPDEKIRDLRLRVGPIA